MNILEKMAKTVMNNSYHLGNKKVALVPIELMDIDYSYQRVTSKKVEDLARDWNEDDCRLLVVSYRDNKFYVMDGQHRYKAAQIIGVKDLHCEIFENLTVYDEAMLFSKQNCNTTRLSPYDIYKSHILMSESDNKELYSRPEVITDLKIKKVCERYGFECAKQPGVRKIHTIPFVRDVINDNGDRMLDDILFVIKASGWDAYKEAFQVKYLKSIYAILKDGSKVDSIVNVLEKTNPKNILENAKSIRSTSPDQQAIELYIKAKIDMKS